MHPITRKSLDAAMVKRTGLTRRGLCLIAELLQVTPLEFYRVRRQEVRNAEEG